MPAHGKRSINFYKLNQIKESTDGMEAEKIPLAKPPSEFHLFRLLPKSSTVSNPKYTPYFLLGQINH